MQKHHDVASPHLTIRKQRSHPRSLRRKLNAVHEYVIADQQRVLHRTRRNLERLHHKCDDEQSRHQHRGQRRQKLHRSLARFLVDFVRLFVVFLSQCDQSILSVSSLPTLLNYQFTNSASIHQPQRPVPTRDLKDMRHGVGKVIQSITHRRWRSPVALSPFTDQ